MILNEKGMSLLEGDLRILGQEFDAAVLSAVRAMETMQQWDEGQPVPPHVVMAAIRAHDRASSIQKRMSGLLRAVHIMLEGTPLNESEQAWARLVDLHRVRGGANLRLLETCKGPLAPYR